MKNKIYLLGCHYEGAYETILCAFHEEDDCEEEAEYLEKWLSSIPHYTDPEYLNYMNRFPYDGSFTSNLESIDYFYTQEVIYYE